MIKYPFTLKFVLSFLVNVLSLSLHYSTVNFYVFAQVHVYMGGFVGPSICLCLYVISLKLPNGFL
jgi:hypothetical protein